MSSVPNGAYSPSALSAGLSTAGAAGAGVPTGRTVYVGNLPATASVDELLNLVHFGPLESIRVLPEKSCVFLSFLDGATAAAFHADALIKKLALHGQELKIGWGKPSAVPSAVATTPQTAGSAVRELMVVVRSRRPGRMGRCVEHDEWRCPEEDAPRPSRRGDGPAGAGPSPLRAGSSVRGRR